MPGHTEAMKAVVSCEKLRSGAHNRDEPQIAEWGNPAVSDDRHSYMESKPWELKHLSTGRKEKSTEMS